MMTIIYFLIGYLTGSIPTAYLITYLFTGKDIREYGSKNPGSTNVFRVAGVWPGIITLVIDFSKGFLPVYLIRQQPDWVVIGTIFFTVLGHTATVFLRFRGGKGVITGCGALAGATPHLAITGILVFLITFFLFRYVSLSSITSAFAIIIYVWLFRYPLTWQVAITLVGVLVIWRHRDNIKRLWRRQEPKVIL